MFPSSISPFLSLLYPELLEALTSGLFSQRHLHSSALPTTQRGPQEAHVALAWVNFALFFQEGFIFPQAPFLLFVPGWEIYHPLPIPRRVYSTHTLFKAPVSFTMEMSFTQF